MTHTPHRLEIENISIGYGDKIIMQDLSFQVPHGARVANPRCSKRWLGFCL
jgi:ABC-type molybdenum transport system ATPase subunit/photorepair protein PhrA